MKKIFLLVLLASTGLTAQTVNVGGGTATDTVTVTDSPTLDFSITGQNLTGSVKSNSLDSNNLKNGGISFEKWSRDGANTGQVPTWNGSAWLPSTPASGSGVTNGVAVFSSTSAITSTARATITDVANYPVFTLSPIGTGAPVGYSFSSSTNAPAFRFSYQENTNRFVFLASNNSNSFVLNPSLSVARGFSGNVGINIPYIEGINSLFTVNGAGYFGGNSASSAWVHISAGTASTPPLRFTSGVNLTTPQSGAVEFDGTRFYGTNSSNARKTFAFLDDISSTNLDQAYNNFGATASEVVVDAAQGQTGGLTFRQQGANAHTVNLEGTGDYIIQDNGTRAFEVNDSGDAAIGPNAPNSSQKLLVTTSGTAPSGIRVSTSTAGADGNGILGLAINQDASDRLAIGFNDPSGSASPRVYMQTNSVDWMYYTPLYTEMRVLRATAKSISFANTGTSVDIDGRNPQYYYTGASIVTVNLPNIISGEPATGEVKVGFEMDVTLTTSSTVTINAFSGDIIYEDGTTSSGTTRSVPAGTTFSKTLKAIADGVWVIK